MKSPRYRYLPALALLPVLYLPQAALASSAVTEARGAFGPVPVATFNEAFSPHGIVGDQKVIFVNEALPTPQVRVLRRSDGRQIATLPSPPGGGFSLPLYARLRNTSETRDGAKGEVVILDSAPLALVGIQPGNMRVYKYSYSERSGFSAQHLGSYPLPVNTNPPTGLPNGFIFPPAFALLPEGKVVVTDLFALWIGDANFSNWELAFISPDFSPSPYCTTVTVNGQQVPGFNMQVRDEHYRKVNIPYQLRFGLGPVLPPLKGVTYVGLTDEIVFNRLGSPGGLFRMPRAAFVDSTIPPYAKPYTSLALPEIGLTDLSGDVVWDSYHPHSEWVYWQRTASAPGQTQCAGAHPYSEKNSPIYRISVLTGKIELLTESYALFDFPTVLGVLEPIGRYNPFTVLVSSNVAEERRPETNAFLTTPQTIAPTFVPVTWVNAYSH